MFIHEVGNDPEYDRIVKRLAIVSGTTEEKVRAIGKEKVKEIWSGKDLDIGKLRSLIQSRNPCFNNVDFSGGNP